MKSSIGLPVLLIGILSIFGGWGFFAHKKINRLAVFVLPVEMIGFYKKNIEYITETSCNPDRRRYAVADEAPKHYIDLDDFGDSAVFRLPRYWRDAVSKYGEDSLQASGILPWHINRMYHNLRDAFFIQDPKRILLYSAEIGHYIADAHVPLHTTSNYDGQKTGQNGIHGFWESRLPEIHFDEYDFFVGSASHIKNVQLKAWDIIANTNSCLDSVLQLEKQLTEKEGDKKFGFENKGKQTVRVYSMNFSKQYHKMLSDMVERQMRKSVKAIADIWYTAWVDAGQPDLIKLKNYQPTQAELDQRKTELKAWKEMMYKPRVHEEEN
jgi:hypothetical protein